MLVFMLSCVLAQTNSWDIDTTFGTNGKVVTDFSSGDDIIYKLVVLPTGKILAGGTATNATKDFALALYNSNGTLDTTFGTGGKVSTDFFGGIDEAYGIVVQEDGKILLSGYATNGANQVFALARYNANGSLDTTFGTGGKVTTTFTGATNAQGLTVALQSDGKIIVVGAANATAATWDFALARYNADGSLDTTFGTGGKVTTEVNDVDQASVVVVLSSGKILAAGSCGHTPNYDYALVQYNANGTLDTTFGTNGKVSTDFSGGNDGISQIVILSDGKILANGSSVNGANNNFALARFSANGPLDTTFGTNGKVTTDFSGDYDLSYDMKVFANGKILLGGLVTNGTNQNFGLARYDANGTLDTTFNTTGKVTTDFAGNPDLSCGLAIQSDGKILAAGQAANATNGDFGIVRYVGDSIPKITIQIGALPKSVGTVEYQLQLPFGTVTQDVYVHVEWDNTTGAVLRLKRQWPAARDEEEEEVRGTSYIDVVYKNITGNFTVMVNHQPAVGANPGSLTDARNVIVKIYINTLPTSLTLTPWIGDPGIGGLPFVHKLGLLTAPTHFTSQYPTGANVSEEIQTTPNWQWIMNDSTSSVCTYPATITVDWQ